MKKHGLWLGLLLASLAPVPAQVIVEVTLEQDQFLSGEALPVAVHITNRSGRRVHLGAQADWLTFSLESNEGRIVPKIGEAPVLGEFDVESSEIATKRLDLAPYFSFEQAGHYRVTATLRIPSWKLEVSSPPKAFDVVEGAKLWDRVFGVPPAPGATNEPPELRRYVLQQVNVHGLLRLYLRVVDASGRALKVVFIGPSLSFSHLDQRVDSASNLHVLYQNGPHSSSYTSYDPEGQLLLRQTYDYAPNSLPHLIVNDNGQILLLGGVRRRTAEDFPAPKYAPPPLEPPPADAAKPAEAPSK